jgi:hypothetical protein
MACTGSKAEKKERQKLFYFRLNRKKEEEE